MRLMVKQYQSYFDTKFLIQMNIKQFISHSVPVKDDTNNKISTVKSVGKLEFKEI